MTLDFDDHAVAAYLEGGAGAVPRDNEQQWQRWAIWPRTLSGVVDPDLTTRVAGLEMSVPIMVAASAGHRLWHPDAEAETARGADAAGILLTLSQVSSLAPDEVAKVAGTYLQQLYLPERRDLVLPFIDRVIDLGAAALVLTVDQLAVDHQHAFRLGLVDQFTAPTWEPYDLRATGASPARSFTVDDISWLVGASRVPVIVKGILHPDDAIAAVDAGASGVVVSNHGGRQVAGSITPAEVLAEIADAVGARASVLVDSGIRDAADVFRALCLGADAAFVGRPVLRALKSGGAPAVARWLSDLRSELEALFALAGVAGIADCHPDRLRLRGAIG